MSSFKINNDCVDNNSNYSNHEYLKKHNNIKELGQIFSTFKIYHPKWGKHVEKNGSTPFQNYTRVLSHRSTQESFTSSKWIQLWLTCSLYLLELWVYKMIHFEMCFSGRKDIYKAYGFIPCPVVIQGPFFQCLFLLSFSISPSNCFTTPLFVLLTSYTLGLCSLYFCIRDMFFIFWKL